MGRAEVAGILAAAGMPVVYWKWPESSKPSFPCIRYSAGGGADLMADNGNYAKRGRWSAILVSEWKDDAAEAALESALESAGVPYSKSADWYSDEARLNHVEYTFTLPR